MAARTSFDIASGADADEKDQNHYDDDEEDEDMEHRLNRRLSNDNLSNKEESRGLVAAENGRRRRRRRSDDDDDDSSDGIPLTAPIRFEPGKCIFYTMVAIFCLSAISIFLPSKFDRTRNGANHLSSSSSIVNFTCPSSFQQGKNYDSSFEAEYTNVTKMITSNMTAFALEFRESKFDDWGRSYEDVKNGMFHWKSTRFTPLKSGDSIFESACGIGLNLYMTLEILQETHNITDLVVYGNEYLSVSAEKANSVMDQIAPAQAHKGVICAGDSSDLSFVPSNAFDLVYTGYISPLLDPLHLNMSLEEEFVIYGIVCTEAFNATSIPLRQQQKAFAQQAQEEQNNWYFNWVQEMIRIAKPGKAVIIEQVSPSFCDAMFDWGGVSKEWWSNSLAQWKDIDPKSLYIENDIIFPMRYHVYLRKKDIV